MISDEKLYLANLAFLLEYEDGQTPDEIDYEIFKIAFQQKNAVHYDRSIGGGLLDLEQDQANIANGILFAANLVESIFIINQEKNFNPYIVVGYNDIYITDKSYKDQGYLIDVQYRLLKDLAVQGNVRI
jgi:outer membrane protein W